MSFENIIGVLLFFIPGLIVSEISRVFRPEYCQKDSWSKLASMIFASFTVYAALKVCCDSFEVSANGLQVYFINKFWLIFIVSAVIGLVWGLASPFILDYVYKSRMFLRDEYNIGGYLGDKPLWDRFFKDNQGKWFDLHLKNGEILRINLSQHSSNNAKEFLVADTAYIVDDKGKKIQMSLICENSAFLINFTEVKYISVVNG